MPTIDLGPCECCGDDPVGVGLCPAFCDVVATVNGLTVNKENFSVSVTEANGTERFLFHAGRRSGTSYTAGVPVTGTSPRSTVATSGGRADLDQEGPACVTGRLHTGANAAQVIAEGRAEIIYSNTRVRRTGNRTTSISPGYIFYRETRREDFRPNWSAAWAWDWDSDGGLLVKGVGVGGRDADGNVVETFPTLDLAVVDLRMPLACLPDGDCQQLSPGEPTPYPWAWDCDCCGQSVTDEGCGPCDNPLP